MAKVVALLLAAIAVSAVLVQVECDAPIDKRLTEASQAINEALDAVVAAAPPAKKAELEDATWKQRMFALGALGVAEGDEKKVATTTLAYKKAASAVLAAAPAEKFKVMKESLEVAARQATA
uniref:Pollen allergen Poa p IX/Phl p VI domain-containing protein n=1 Tax=Oryza punctata TaxID=4537 RepID=A0A0E0M112_ORYPU